MTPGLHTTCRYCGHRFPDEIKPPTEDDLVAELTDRDIAWATYKELLGQSRSLRRIELAATVWLVLFLLGVVVVVLALIGSRS